MHGLDERYDLMRRERSGVEVGNEPPGDVRGSAIQRRHCTERAEAGRRVSVERRDIHPLDLRKAIQRGSAVLECRGFRDLDDSVLAFADQDSVEERRQRLRVHRPWASPDHERIARPAIGRAHRHSREVEHVEDVGVGQLIGQRDANGVELAQGRARLQREQRQAPRSQLLLHVRPGREAPLGREVGMTVENVVEDLQPEMGHPEFVAVGIAEGEASANRRRILADRVPLATGITCGLLYPRQDHIQIQIQIRRISPYFTRRPHTSVPRPAERFRPSGTS